MMKSLHGNYRGFSEGTIEEMNFRRFRKTVIGMPLHIYELLVVLLCMRILVGFLFLHSVSTWDWDSAQIGPDFSLTGKFPPSRNLPVPGLPWAWVFPYGFPRVWCMGIEVQSPWQQSQSVLKSYWELATDGERKLLAVNPRQWWWERKSGRGTCVPRGWLRELPLQNFVELCVYKNTVWFKGNHDIAT